MTYDKPFKTFLEMAQHLEDVHGLSVIGGDEEREHIASLLRVIPYYDLVNGYKDFFMTNDRFDPGTRITDLLLFYSFDRGFQNVLFPFSIMVEDYFKNTLAYVLARDFGVSTSDYLSNRNYVTGKGRLQFGDVKQKIQNIYTQDPQYIEEPTRHYVLNHNHVPPWILLKNVTFSVSSNLFTLLKPTQMEEVADLMISAPISVDQKIQILSYSLTLIRKCRNTMAHNLKFISFDSQKYSYGINRRALSKWIPRELVSAKELSRGVGIHDIYAYILFSVALIPDCLHKLLLLARLTAYLDYFHADKDLSVLWSGQYAKYAAATHLPPNLSSRLESYQQTVAKRLSTEAKNADL